MRRLALLALALVCVCSGPTPQAQQKPNILLIQADDLGYGDLSAYGQARSKRRRRSAGAQGHPLHPVPTRAARCVRRRGRR